MVMVITTIVITLSAMSVTYGIKELCAVWETVAIIGTVRITPTTGSPNKKNKAHLLPTLIR